MQNPFAEHIIFSFYENIISRFDVAVNDVLKEFAEKLQFVFETENLRTCGLYHPNWLIYLFLAVFAFSSPFCYAKTAFSCSPDLLSPCTPVLFMVKDVVKSEYRMIVMWSWFWGGRSARKLLRRQRRNAQRSEKKYTNSHMWSTVRKEMISMWSGKSSSQEQRTPSSFFCGCCIVT